MFGGLVDQVAGHEHTFGNRLRINRRLLGSKDGARDDGHFHRLRRSLLVVIVLLRRLVSVEAVGIHLHAEGEIGRSLAGNLETRRIEKNCDLFGTTDFRRGRTASLQPVMRRQIGAIADTKHQDAIDRRALRRNNVESSQRFRLELGDSRRLGNNCIRIGFRSACRLFSVKSLEQDRQAARQAG
jgi:hypothetical protein